MKDWDDLIDYEEKASSFLSGISTLIEDAPEITLQLYLIVGYGTKENTIG